MSASGITRFLLLPLKYFLAALAILVTLLAIASLFQLNYSPPEKEHIYPALPIKAYSSSPQEYDYDSLLAKYGRNKTLPSGYKLQTLLALMHYPQLQEAEIHFLIEPETLPLASRPLPWTIFLPKKYWQYNIMISSESRAFSKDMLFERLPFNAQVGILGHELAHTLHYQDKTALEIALIGLSYASPTYRAAFEKNTDRITVQQGLGWQLLTFASFLRKSPAILQQEKDWLDQYYLNDSLITKEMQRLTIYSNVDSIAAP
jgi:hypothetical protein